MRNAIYKVDNGQGGFDEISFKTNANQVILSDGRNLQNVFDVKSKLWEGSYYMTEKDTVRLKKSLSKCDNGIVLVWSDYDPGSANVGNNYNWVTTFIPKVGSFINSGNYFCPVPNSESTSKQPMIVKAIYIKDSTIVGSDTNRANGADDVVLREVWEV